MRIAMFMPSLGPDALGWGVHRDFAAAVERLGHSFELLTTPQPGADGASPSADSAVSETSEDGAATVLIEPGRSHLWGELGRPLLRTRQLLPAAGALAGHLKSQGEGIDLLHLEVAYPHAAAGALATARSGWKGPVAVTPMGEDILIVSDRSYGMRRYPVPAGLVKWTLRRAAALRCISPLAEQTIARLSPNNPRRVIPLNISENVARAATSDDNERTRFRAAARARTDEEFGTAGRPLVLSFGRLHPFKGIDYLVDAAASIGDAKVLVIGPSMTVRPFGDIADALRRRAEERGVADKVNVAGAVHPSRALEVLAAADVVVVASPLESLNKVCMEAAAVGTPFVVTQTTGISAWVPDEGVGIVVPPRNAAAIAWAIEEIIGGHFAYDAPTAARFAGRFSPDTVAAEVMEFYEEVVGGRPASMP
jgi:glycosyltransferase involved in cell wall biosynthesis